MTDANPTRLHRLTRLAAEDPAVHRLMTDVAQLLTPSSVLREPAIAERLARAMEADPAQ